MKSYKIGACGNFDLDQNFLNGQIIRTRSIVNQLEKEIGVDQIKRLSYSGWNRHPFSTLRSFVSLMWKSENVLLFPDLRAIYGLVPLAVLLKKFTGTKVYYNVIGGWLPTFLRKHRILRRCTKKLDGLFVQTNHISDLLGDIGVKQVTVFPNFKDIKIYALNEKPTEYTKPLSLVFMSRITSSKGIKELVSTVQKINRNEIRYTLDIYGSVQNDFTEEFEELRKHFDETIRYKGQVDPLQTSTAMKDYFLHVFPTMLTNTEGFPGSVLDALSAGVPTLAAKWVSYSDVLEEGVTGLSFTLGNWSELEKKLENIYLNPDMVWSMREACIKEAQKYRPENIIKIMLKQLDV